MNTITFSPLPQISPNFQAGRKLIPLKDYKGVVLKLTKSDKAKIAELEKKIGELEMEHQKLTTLSEKRYIGVYSEAYYFNEKKGEVEMLIDELRASICNIKITRLAKQKAKLQKRLDTIV